MKTIRFTIAVFLILSIPHQVYSEEKSNACSSSGSIRVSPASATCPYAKKKYMVNMDGTASGSLDRKESGGAKRKQEGKSDQEIKRELKAKSLSANRLEKSYEETRAEEARKLHKKMEWQARLKSAEDWCRKHCSFVLKARDKIVESIDSMKRSAGKKYILINGEEYIEKNGEFIKLKETVRGK